MKVFKKLMSLIMVCIFTIINMLNLTNEVYAATANDGMVINDEYILFGESGRLKDIGTISVKKSIMIDGEKNYLFPTFDDMESALAAFKERANDILTVIKNDNGIDELSEDNWEEYYDLIYSLQGYDEREKDFALGFFDIYENKSVNDDIIYCVENEADRDLKREMLYILLPYTEPFVIEYNNSRITAYSNFNIYAAVDYAMTYAVTPNSYDYAVLDKDCTNFASQIVENGGISQDNSVEWPTVGWWHAKDGNAHYHSRSWTLANEFAKYFGLDYTTNKHFSFSANVHKGDFILLDDESDGSWNHAGFVLEADSYLTNGYYDYFVAQHSANYHLWTSTPDNHWEEKEAEGYTYGIIRP